MNAALREQFLLRDDITFLNFGSFGACPRPVFEAYRDYQTELEREPVVFITEKSNEYLAASRDALGGYINCPADDVVFVTNPSYAINIIGKSLDLQPGDEVLTTSLEYGACDMAWRHYCKKKGAKYVQHPMTLPVQSRESFVQEFLSAVTPGTRLIFISHITSATALQLPVAAICKAAKEKGIMTFVDGAHAPGHIDLDLQALDVDIYTGACHKWMMAPKGCSFLYVRKSLQHLFDPLIISWGYESPQPSLSLFQNYHQVQGTRDFSAFLCISDCLKFMEEHDWKQVSEDCKKIVRENASRFLELLNTETIAPVDDFFTQQMFAIPIETTTPEKLHQYFYEVHKIQVPVMPHNGRFYLRYSINGFNSQSDLDKLFTVLKDGKWKNVK